MTAPHSRDPTLPPDPDEPVHHVVRDICRITLTSKEYRFLHDHAIQRGPTALREKTPSPSRYDEIIKTRSRYNYTALRSSIRVFLGTGAALKLASFIAERLQRRAGGASGASAGGSQRVRLIDSPNFRVPLALSLVLLVHRLLHRFFLRLRASLRTEEASPFCARNPRLARALTSRYAPAVGASVAGFALGVCPQKQLRMTLAIWMSTRSMEFLFNVLDEKGWFENRPKWFGSWMLMPLSCAQLFHAFVFDRETTPKWFGKVILSLSPSYIHDRPAQLPASVPWSDREEAVDSLAAIAKLRWPYVMKTPLATDAANLIHANRAFVSPMLHPGNPNTLPATVRSIDPITGPAHPSISSLSCALLHPELPGCSTAFLHNIALSVPKLAKIITTFTLALSVLKFKEFSEHPLTSLQNMCKRIVKLTAVLSAAVGSAWASLCFWNGTLSRATLPTKRFYLSGFLGGLPFFFVGNSRHIFMYFFRAAVDSAWKSGVKRGLWRGWDGGELWLIVLAWAAIGSMLEARPSTVQGPGIRKLFAFLRGDNFVDPVEVLAKKKAKRVAAKKESDVPPVPDDVL